MQHLQRFDGIELAPCILYEHGSAVTQGPNKLLYATFAQHKYSNCDSNTASDPFPDKRSERVA